MIYIMFQWFYFNGLDWGSNAEHNTINLSMIMLDLFHTEKLYLIAQ